MLSTPNTGPDQPQDKDPKACAPNAPNGELRDHHPPLKPPVMAKLMSAATQKTRRTNWRSTTPNTPPHQTGIEIGGGPSSVCNPNGGYNSTTTLGTCLWTGERSTVPPPSQTPSTTWVGSTTIIPQTATESCKISPDQAQDSWLNPAKGDPVYAPVLDGCAFAEKTKPSPWMTVVRPSGLPIFYSKNSAGKKETKLLSSAVGDYDYNNDGPGN
ncbi:hypothetical protein H4Q26_008672 [Puccinia striiformis f. sp. tritici PST-130]|nr:hypothetical protein H4Q26_008672 [Puccinia striiformis f. sp. tritici PST-130]